MFSESLVFRFYTGKRGTNSISLRLLQDKKAGGEEEAPPPPPGLAALSQQGGAGAGRC